MTVSDIYRPRIQAFRDHVLKILPSVPNDGSSRTALKSLPTHQLILAFLNWRTRFVPQKPRKVRLWPNGVTLSEFHAVEAKLRPLLTKIEEGKDLSPHLSQFIFKKGIVLPNAKPEDRGKDIDAVLTRFGLHHFHVGVIGPDNPKGRSGVLIFAEVQDEEFRIIAISNHEAFKQGSAEGLRFSRICQAYLVKDVLPGQIVMTRPVMSSGHSFSLTRFSDWCANIMEECDPQLDDFSFVESLYKQQSLENGEPVAMPSKPRLVWYFNEFDFGLLDQRSKVFFCLKPERN